jgi:hypothetical protein
VDLIETMHAIGLSTVRGKEGGRGGCTDFCGGNEKMPDRKARIGSSSRMHTPPVQPTDAQIQSVYVGTLNHCCLRVGEKENLWENSAASPTHGERCWHVCSTSLEWQ